MLSRKACRQPRDEAFAVTCVSSAAHALVPDASVPAWCCCFLGNFGLTTSDNKR